MKKLFLLICLMATTVIASATDVWEGTHAVDWSNTLTIEAAKFADAQVGQKIVFEFKDATGEVIELHSNGGMLPGTRYAHYLYADQHEMEVFITPGMLACLKEHGMEICGKGFTATKVWYGDGKDNVPNSALRALIWLQDLILTDSWFSTTRKVVIHSTSRPSCSSRKRWIRVSVT